MVWYDLESMANRFFDMIFTKNQSWKDFCR